MNKNSKGRENIGGKQKAEENTGRKKKHPRRDHATSGSSGNNLIPTSRSASWSSLDTLIAGEKKEW